MTLYARWDYEPIVITNDYSGANEVEKAISYADTAPNANVGNAYTLLIDDDYNIGTQITSNANFNLRIIGWGEKRIIQSSNFVISAGSLSLGSNIVLNSVAILQNANINLSDNAELGELTLNASAIEKATLTVSSGWNGEITALNLRGESTNITDVISYWDGNTVLSAASGTLELATIAYFNEKLGNFLGQSALIEQAISDTHVIDNDGILREKQGFVFVIPPFDDNSPDTIATNLTLSRSEANTASFKISNPNDYTLIEWYFGLVKLSAGISGTKGETLALAVSGVPDPSRPYDILGTQIITVEVITVLGAFYTTDFVFTVAP